MHRLKLFPSLQAGKKNIVCFYATSFILCTRRKKQELRLVFFLNEGRKKTCGKTGGASSSCIFDTRKRRMETEGKGFYANFHHLKLHRSSKFSYVCVEKGKSGDGGYI